MTLRNMFKFLGLDYGIKRIGVAIADEETRLATPYGIIENKSPSFVVGELEKIIKKEGIEKIVVGIPISLGGIGVQGVLEGQEDKEDKEGLLREVLGFVKYLKNKLGVRIETEDERFSSEQVNSLMKGLKKKAEKDAVAAMIILQSYLDKLKE